MKFHTQLRVISTLSIVPILLVGIFLVISTSLMNTAAEKIVFVNESIKEISSMRTVMFDYAQGSTERAEKQLRRIEQKLTALFARTQFQSSSERELLGYIERDYQRVRTLFAELQEKNAIQMRGEPAQQAAARKYANILLAQFGILSQNIITQSFQLHDLINRHLEVTRNIYNTLILSMIALFTAIIPGISLFVNAQIKRSVAHLLQVAHQLRDGNLDYEIDSAETNEFQAVYVAFNQMIAQINASYKRLTQEIEERKHAEKALRESEAKYRRLVEHSNDLVCEIDMRGHFLFLNPQYEQILGYAPQELLGRSAKELIHPDHLQASTPKLQQVITTRTASRDQWRFQHKNGEWRWFECASQTYESAPGEIRIVVISRDITERKLAEEQSKEHARRLEEAVQQKQRDMEALYDKLLRQEKLATIGQMAGSIAHELRNPLGAVKQSVYYLKRLAHNQELTASNPKVLRHLDLIDAELATSAQVITSLLDMTHMNPPKCQPTGARVLIEEVLQRCHLPEQIQVTTSLQPESLTLVVDPLQMRQVLLNVLTNAAQSIQGDGAITVSAKQLTEPKEAVIEVRDSGGGIAPDALSKVFEPLYTTKANGTGLGLSICKQIIENHDGRITLTSHPDHGTTVTIVLPCHH